MNMKDAVISVLVNWKNFDGRACRSEFWYFGLASGLFGFIIGFVEVATGIVDVENAGAGVLSFVFSFAILVPSISVTSGHMTGAVWMVAAILRHINRNLCRPRVVRFAS